MSSNGKRTAWLRSLEANTVLVDLFDAELRRDCGTPLSWYDMLIKIWLAPGHALRMSDLADQALLSRSWLTRRVDQLEDAGLVVRSGDDTDGRGVVVSMTEQGVRDFAAMERSHSRSIARHFSAHVTQEEAAVLRAVCARLTAAGAQALRDLHDSGQQKAVRPARSKVAS